MKFSSNHLTELIQATVGFFTSALEFLLSRPPVPEPLSEARVPPQSACGFWIGIKPVLVLLPPVEDRAQKVRQDAANCGRCQ
jgi:hypothetical protein